MVNSFNWLFLPVFNVDGYRFTQEVSNTGKIINSDPRAYYVVLCWGREISRILIFTSLCSQISASLGQEIEKAPNSPK